MKFPWDKDMKQSYEIIKYPDGTSYVKVHKFDTKVVYRINYYGGGHAQRKLKIIEMF